MVLAKKKTLEHPKACPLKRAKYLRKLNDFIAQGYPIVYMDESGFEAETIRLYGYAAIGTPCIDRYNWQGKKRTNVIGALYGKMLFALDYFEKNINGDIFYDWCKYTLIPNLKRKCVIVMDNASFHKRVQRLLNRHGHRLLFLPPYSPDLNPIEKKWAQVKFLRQGWMENDLSKLFYDICPRHNSFMVQ
ncbi:IS630 family transposase [Psychrobacter sp. AOP22-C1-22]|uniref:IS630 family transposase n=3 Tax=Moraxellaceae TaxID=468 RepID=UPI001787CB98|nr:IS630 family transposase [Psychrobacter sp. FME6]MBE0406156.1 IS630 family transposase [Psychrobacter sp. FME6]MDN5802747.1 IS630 family transposase [Psychrobacter sp.]